MDLYAYIGQKIRELRLNYAGTGMSQDELAQKMATTANTISRWETAAYKPSVDELHRLATFFRVSISTFFPEMTNSKLQALLSATGDLKEDELVELTEYARFRRARRALTEERAKKRPRK